MIPLTMKLQLTHRWDYRTPVIVRYMPKRFIDDFFQHGRLRLSSFLQFSKHTDEARKDNDEGYALISGSGGGRTIYARVKQGHSSFVLCGSTREDPELQREFGCDSYFRIVNTMCFARLIAKQIPNYTAGLEGHCIYTGVRAIRRRIVLSEADVVNQEGDNVALPVGEIPNDERMLEIVAKLADTPDAYLLKNYKYRSQCEYRIVWHTSVQVPDTLDLVCPDARLYCERP